MIYRRSNADQRVGGKKINQFKLFILQKTLGKNKEGDIVWMVGGRRGKYRFLWRLWETGKLIDWKSSQHVTNVRLGKLSKISGKYLVAIYGRWAIKTFPKLKMFCEIADKLEAIHRNLCSGNFRPSLNFKRIGCR